MSRNRRMLFFSITLVALGVIFSTTLSESFGALGTVFIAVGGLFFIIAMANRKKEQLPPSEN